MTSIPSLVPRDRYAALERCTYLNQASLGLIPVPAIDAMDTFLKQTAQFGNLYLSDEQERSWTGFVRPARKCSGPHPTRWPWSRGRARDWARRPRCSNPSRDGPPRPIGLPERDVPVARGRRARWDLAAVHRRPRRPRPHAGSRRRDRSGNRSCDLQRGPVRHGHAGRRWAGGGARAQVGARVVVDATQLAGAGVVDTIGWGADALVTSGYKWLSSHGGVALLALAPDLVTRLPGLIGWMGAQRPFDLDPLKLRLADDARRFELSTMSYVSAIGLESSIAMLSSLGFERIDEHARHLAAHLVDRVAELGWRPFRAPGDPSAASTSCPAARGSRSSGDRGTSRLRVPDHLRPSSGRSQDLPPRLQRRRGCPPARGGPEASPSLRRTTRLAARELLGAVTSEGSQAQWNAKVTWYSREDAAERVGVEPSTSLDWLIVPEGRIASRPATCAACCLPDRSSMPASRSKA